MANYLFESMGFSICGLVFLSFIFIMFLAKKKYKTFESKIFAMLLVLTLLLLVNEICYVFAMNAYDKYPMLCEIVCRIYILGSIIWLCEMIAYIWCLSRKNKKYSIKKVIVTSIIFITVIYIISCFLPIEYYTGSNGWYSFGGDAVIVVYIIGFFVIGCILFSFLKKNNRLQREQKLPLYFTFAFFSIASVIQMITGYDLNILTFIFAFSVSSIYFTIESQDNKLLDDLEKSKKIVEEANQAKTEFLSNMSHEIRTPLNTILGFSNSLLGEENLTEEIVKRDAKSINDASNSLLNLINNILDISRIESGKEVVVEKEYNIEDILVNINNIVTTKILKENLSFKIVIDENIPSRYYGDNVKISKILLNVITNAIKYTNYGEIVLYVDGETIDSSYNLKFTIANTGHAMKKEEFDKSFNEFVKLGKSSDNNLDSVTLGFIIAKQLLAMIGGTMEFENETGKGTKYIINIKEEVINSSKVGNILEESSINKIDKIDCTGLSVLVVDDNEINIKLASRLLKEYNFDIETTNSGNKCIQMVQNKKYDLIFLDHMMPELDGVETLKILKLKGYTIPPVIALTANSYSGIEDKYIKEGFYGYLSKPINVKDLNIIIKKLFGNR